MKTPRHITAPLGAILVAIAIMLNMAPSASAASLGVKGTVNCNGSTTVYPTVRKTTQANRKVEIKVTDFTKYHWKSWGIYQEVSGTKLGAYVVAANSYTSPKLATARNPWVTIMDAKYVVNTRFRITAAMVTHHRGTCDASWGGTLYY